MLDSSTTSQQIYGGIALWQLIEERDGVAAAAGVLATHVYGLGIDDLVQTRSGPPGFEQTYFFHADEQGTITAATDSSGTVVERYRYGDYGSVTILAPDGATVRTTSIITNRHLYTGRLWLGEIGLYEYRHRYYDPSLGRFITRDPTGYAFGMNLYAYANSSPTDDVDPLGLFPPDTVMDARVRGVMGIREDVGQFAAEHPRLMGGVQAVGGAFEVVAGAGLAVGTAPTVVGVGVGGAVGSGFGLLVRAFMPWSPSRSSAPRCDTCGHAHGNMARQAAKTVAMIRRSRDRLARCGSSQAGNVLDVATSGAVQLRPAAAEGIDRCALRVDRGT